MAGMIEEWREVIGYEGIYEVSNFGRIKSFISHGRILTPTDNGNGYLVVSLWKDKERSNHYIHRLVAECFCENTHEYPVVNHIDYNTKNNLSTNLEWCTQKMNVVHSSERMRKPKSTCKQTNTGEKYIRRLSRGNQSRYRLIIRSKGIDKLFKTLDDAIEYRNEVLDNGQHYFAR